jgi:putative SOS response-associated peptidase YedK
MAEAGKLRQPFLIRRKDQAPLAFAGLWERWRQPGTEEVVRSCTIITCPANDLVAPLHDRMPVMLSAEAHARWLDPKTDARDLLKPCSSAWLEAFAVDRRVNSPNNDDPECIRPTVVQSTLAL